MASYKVAYGAKDNITKAIQTGVIPPATIILTEDSNEMYFFDLDKNLIPYEERYKFESLEEAQRWVDTYNCKGRILSVHEHDTCNIYVVNYNNKLALVSGSKYVSEDRDPTEADYDYEVLTHWINTATEEVYILTSVLDTKAKWKPITGSSGGTVKQVQADWSTTDVNDPSYIKNKPEISGSGDVTYRHTQSISSDTWFITHNLGKYPSVTIVDSSGSVVIGDITYIDVNSLIIKFTGAFSGKAYLN